MDNRTAIYQKNKQISTLFANDKEKADRFLAIAYQASLNKNLVNCNQDSIVNAVIQAAQLDLSIDNQIGQAYLVPYKGNAQLQIGFRGWQVLLKRFGYAVKTYPIYNTDTFIFKVDGWEEKIIFEPNFDDREDGDKNWVIDNLKGVWSLIKDSNGEVFTAFISKKQIEKLRKTSSNQSNAPAGIWLDWYAEMAQAKAIKQHCKKMPLAETLVKIIKDDDLIEIGEQPEQKEESKQNLNSLLLAQEVPSHNSETGEIIEPIDIRKSFRGLLIQNKVERAKAFEIEKSLSDADIQAYLDDPASVETLLVFG